MRGDDDAQPLRRDRVGDLVDTATLEALLGPLLSLERSPLATIGYTASHHELLTATLADGTSRRLVLKRVEVGRDWTAVRSGDRRGREAALLLEPTLAGVWKAFDSPYHAVAVEGGEIGLLMRDLTPHLFPDVREPLRAEEEQAVVDALAALHARFWASPAVALPWLAPARTYAGLLDAPSARDPEALAALTPMLRDLVPRGWEAALAAAPAAVRDLLTCPAEDLEPHWRDLPATLVHGDVKVANFALLPSGRVAAFDWALVGAAPAAVDVGWYLAVNATRLAHTKETFLDRYRSALRAARGADLDAATWAALSRAAVVFGARMLLWTKALALAAGGERAQREWSWWMERLAAV